jgi:hypothetical protein
MNKRIIKSNDEAAGGASFNTVTYTGNDLLAGIQVTGVGFQPDLVWIKARTSAQNHDITDSVRGTHKWLASNLTQAETDEPLYGIDSFDLDGFTISSSGGRTNAGFDYVAWCWKAGGAAVTNTDGTITSQVSANVDAGFSIVSYTGTGTTTGTVGHGLGLIPSVFIVKERTATSTSGGIWGVHFVPENLIAFLNLTNAAGDGTNGGTNGGFATNQTTDTTLQFITGFNSNNNWNNNGSDYIAYCFAEVAGFSKFGSYVGTGENGNDQVLGFEPAFAIFKRTTSTSSWFIIDNKRSPSNPRNLFLNADTSDAEYTPTHGVEFLENGFRFISTDLNGLDQTWIYMAFANQF